MNSIIFFLISESAGNHQKTPSDLPAIVWNDILQCNIAQWQIIMYITYGKVFGGTPNIFMFWLFPENGSISERTVNGINSSYNPIKFWINKNVNFHFRHVPELSIGFNSSVCPCNDLLKVVSMTLQLSWCQLVFLFYFFQVHWNLVIKRSNITKPSYSKKYKELVQALYISLSFTLI